MLYAEVTRILWKPFAVIARPIALVPLVVAGLLALDGGAAHAQRCFICDAGDCELQEEGKFGGQSCTMGSMQLPDDIPLDPGKPDHIDTCFIGGGLCEVERRTELDAEGLEAEMQGVFAMVRSGQMLPSDSRYFVAAQGQDRVVRRKCGGALVGVVAMGGTPERSLLGRGRAT